MLVVGSGAGFPGEDGRCIVWKAEAVLRMFNPGFWRSFSGFIEVVVGDVERMV